APARARARCRRRGRRGVLAPRGSGARAGELRDGRALPAGRDEMAGTAGDASPPQRLPGRQCAAPRRRRRGRGAAGGGPRGRRTRSGERTLAAPPRPADPAPRPRPRRLGAVRLGDRGRSAPRPRHLGHRGAAPRAVGRRYGTRTTAVGENTGGRSALWSLFTSSPCSRWRPALSTTVYFSRAVPPM